LPVSVLTRNHSQLCLVLHGIIFSFTSGGTQKGVGEMFCVARMRGRSRGYCPRKSPRYHHVGGCSADSALGLFAKGVYPARSLKAVPAAKSRLAKTALGKLCLKPVSYGSQLQVFCAIQRREHRLVL